ncbi:MAG: homoserine dehydrogenase [Alphaproteobacteria bacterium]|nr:homoserine dehydrogenase [Alphaproteobacteria bacterium]
MLGRYVLTTKHPLRIAIAGLGTVGSATLDMLEKNRDLICQRAGRNLQVVAVAARDKTKHLQKIKNGIQWFDNACDLAPLPTVDVVVVLIGGDDGIALKTTETALRNGKSVVTANKALMATHGVRLSEIAEETGAQLMFEAAVAGEIPVIKTLREASAGDRITSVQGILNGTCNYILTRIGEDGLTFEEALKEAQNKGFAEAEPSLDVDGHDTAHKLALLAALAFGIPPSFNDVSVEGIRNVSSLDIHFANELGYKIKLLGTARLTDRGLEKYVGPCLVPKHSVLANTNDVLNAVSIQIDTLDPITLTGRGAGGKPTASAVVADLMDLARGSSVLPFGIPAAMLKNVSPALCEEKLSSWYIRMRVFDKPGALTSVSTIFSQKSISIESVIQRGQPGLESVPVIIKTHEVSESAMRWALAKISKLETIQETPCAFRVEEPAHEDCPDSPNRMCQRAPEGMGKPFNLG